jgi:cystathionine beta-lyase/cystathionine gamma-synthase
MKHLAHPGFGAGGVLAVDMGSAERADRFVRTLAETGTARIAVSLGCPRTVVTVPGTSTAAEIPEEQREAMGLTPGLVRIAAGIEDDIEGLVSGMKQAAGASTRAGVS